MQKSHPCLKELRKERGFTLESLSERSTIPVSTLGHIEAGSRKASMEHIDLLAAALDMDPVEILDSVEFRGYRHRVIPPTAVREEHKPTAGDVRAVLQYLPDTELRAAVAKATARDDWHAVAVIGAELASRQPAATASKFAYPKPERTP